MDARWLIVLLPVLLGCSADVVGNWSATSSCGKWALDAFDDGTADASIFTGDCQKMGYDAYYEVVADGWEFELDCDSGPCASFEKNGDFSMYCEFPEDTEDSDTMPCKGRFFDSASEKGYVFTDIVWSRL